MPENMPTLHEQYDVAPFIWEKFPRIFLKFIWSRSYFWILEASQDRCWISSLRPKGSTSNKQSPLWFMSKKGLTKKHAGLGKFIICFKPLNSLIWFSKIMRPRNCARGIKCHYWDIPPGPRWSSGDEMHFAVFDYDFDKNDCLGSAVLKGHGMERKLYGIG